METARFVLLLAALTGVTCLFMRKHVHVSHLLTWTDAHAYCRENYVDLSAIETAEELKKFKIDTDAYVNDRSWIGLSREPDVNAFTQWSDGSVIGTTNWKFSDPRYLTNQYCVFAFKALWDENSCADTMSFFCYVWEPQLVMVQQMKTWEEALVHCRTYYTDLISLTTDADLSALKVIRLTRQTPSVWTGLRFLDGSWFWMDMQLLANHNLPSCPARPFFCGAYNGYALEFRDCDEKMYFICYRLTGV